MPDTPITIRPEDPETPAARACLAAYFALLTQRIPAVTMAHVPDPDPEAYAYRPPNGAFLLAWAHDAPMACVCVKSVTPTTGEVKRLWVNPAARGMGLARKMMTAIEDCARANGKSHLRLDTNNALPEAIQLYRSSGWSDITPFSDFPATNWLGKAL